MTETQEQELIEKAVDYYYAANFIQAIELFEKALAVNPNNQSAIQYLQKAKTLQSHAENEARIPREAIQFYRRARSYLSANLFEEAIASLEAAVDFADASSKRFPEAEELYFRVRRLARQPKKVKVFISYSRKHDLEVAKAIYSFFLDNGCAPWMDIYDLVPGQDWESAISENIKSSDFFIACLSRHSVSNRGYILKELKEAISVLEQTPESEIYLIPIRIDDCVVPRSLSSRQWLDWSASNAKASLLTAVKSKK